MRTRYLLVLLVALLAWSASASIGVGPLTLIIDAGPGGSGSGYFKVINNGQNPEEVTISLSDWTLGPDGGIQFAEPGTVDRSLANWISYSPATFRLEPGQLQRVDFTITVPSEKGGDHWALFFVEGSEVTPVAETTGALTTTVGVKVRYGIKVFQRDPAATRIGRITGLELLSLEPLKLELSFANAGDGVLFRVTGQMEIRDATGTTVRTLEIEEFTVLPGGARELVLEDKGERLPPGDYIALAIIDFGGDYLVGQQLQFKI
ncbi:MAG: fimbrial biogenesis chaperone [Candidatus Bipolaricaulia bacterium]